MKNKFHFLMLTISILLLGTEKVNAQSTPSCKLTDSIYLDSRGKGFEVRLQPPSNNLSRAKLTVNHKSRGTVFEFDMIQQQGYGAIFLTDRNKSDRGNRINFFDSNFSSASIFRSDVAPPYLFITKLGSRDHYENDVNGGEGRSKNVGDPMWKLDRCIGQSRSSDTEINEADKASTVSPDQSIAPPSKNITSRPLTQQDLALLDRTIRDQKPKPRVADRTHMKPFTNNLLKPFIGAWTSADNQQYFVYPGKGRKTCIIVENGSIQNLQFGIAVGNATGTDMNVGTGRMFKTKNDSVLALRTSDSDRLVPLYAAAITTDLTDGNKEAMKDNGCMTGFPGLPAGGTIAAKPPVQPSAKTCPEGMFPAHVPLNLPSPSHAFFETAGRFKDGIGTTPGIIEKSQEGTRKILADTRCSYLKEISNVSNPQRTWLVIHGWDNNVDDYTSATPAVADALKAKYPNDRVLALDWSEASNNQGRSKARGVYYAASWIRPIAEATVQQLREKYGIDDLSAINNLNIVGHSLGSLMSAEIGYLYRTGVNSIIALDPASELTSLGDTFSALGGYDLDGRTPAYKIQSKIPFFDFVTSRELIEDNIDRQKCFGSGDGILVKLSLCRKPGKRLARISRSFVGSKSISANQGFAASADESFLIDFPITSIMGEHGAVAEVFKNMVAQTYFNEFIGSEDLNLHNNIKRGSDGHAGIIQVNSSNIPTRLLLEHEIEGSLVIRIDGKVYHRPLLDKIIPWSELIEAGSISSLFPSK